MNGATYFFSCVLLLIIGYFVYGKITEKIFGMDANRPTPVKTMADGVDYVEMPAWRIFLIQFLNIAGLGPVFGPIVGALYGPAALLWVVLGSIFAGAVHDYVSGMISLRYNGASYPEVIGQNLGNGVRKFMEWYSAFFLILVGAVFVIGPAAILSGMTNLSLPAWAVIIFAYYVIATILPIDMIIGRVYPIFAALLLVMGFGLIFALLFSDKLILPNISFADFFVSQHPKELPIWPGLFIVIACGALSGFHATQSPMMARCMGNEKQGRPLFYGAMIAEGVIALIWVTLGLSFYESPQALSAAGAAPVVVKEISVSLLGGAGGFLAILGVVVLPISTGDTAFRCARIILADAFKLNQVPLKNRFLLAIPIFALGIALTFVDFNVIWRYFGWANQTMACVCLWACAVYLARQSRFHWIATIPAIFMTVVTVTFICSEKIGFNLSVQYSTAIGIIVAAIIFIIFAKTNIKVPMLSSN